MTSANKLRHFDPVRKSVSKEKMLQAVERVKDFGLREQLAHSIMVFKPDSVINSSSQYTKFIQVKYIILTESINMPNNKCNNKKINVIM